MSQPTTETATATTIPVVARTPTRRESHCSYCFRTDHNISRCRHPYVEYVFLELMWFYLRYGDRFVCNNLPCILRPKDAQVLLGYEPIRRIREGPPRFRQMVQEVGMPARIRDYYKKLIRKIESIYYNSEMSSIYFENMEVVEPTMRETLILYETMPNSMVMDSSSIMVGREENPINLSRGVRFRHYDSIIRSQPFSQQQPHPVASTAATSPSHSEEWLEARRPPRNVTMRSRTHIRWVEDRVGNMEQLVAIEDSFGRWAAATVDFETIFKQRQTVEVEIVLEEPDKTETCIECPICMSDDIVKQDSVNLGCCVYSFCSDCYSKQYMTKENRTHQCMMCRSPFSKVKVFGQSVVDKLKTPIATSSSSSVHFPFPVFSNNPSSVVQVDDEEFNYLTSLISFP